MANDDANDQLLENPDGKNKQPTPTRRKKAALGTWSLILAIGNICVLGQESSLRLLAIPISILAVLFGVGALSQIRRSQGAVTGKPRAIAGIVIAIWVGITPILLPLMDMARQAARQSEAKSLLGRLVPPFHLKRTDGGSVSSTSLNRSVYLLDFWPIPDSLPKLDALAKKYKGDGLIAFAVVPDYAAQEASAFARANALDIPILLASETGETAKAFRAYHSRETVLVGRDGRILRVFFGGTYAGEIEDAIKAALATK